VRHYGWAVKVPIGTIEEMIGEISSRIFILKGTCSYSKQDVLSSPAPQYLQSCGLFKGKGRYLLTKLLKSLISNLMTVRNGSKIDMIRWHFLNFLSELFKKNIWLQRWLLLKKRITISRQL